jgi:hypothetical protein
MVHEGIQVSRHNAIVPLFTIALRTSAELINTQAQYRFIVTFDTAGEVFRVGVGCISTKSLCNLEVLYASPANN